MDVFPLPRSSAYSYARNFGAHLGTDIMAPLGTPVLAVEDGKAWTDIDPKGGKVAYLQGMSGQRYYYAHLDSWATKLIQRTQQSPLSVSLGTELGTVGTTGNAKGGAPHLHFQSRRGSAVFDPFNELLRVDPHKRGVDAGGGMGKGILVLAVLWALSQRGGL